MNRLIIDDANLKIRYFGNSALLVESETPDKGTPVRVLADGLISDEQPFDPVDPEVESALMNGGFGAIDALLFTHCHRDHYDGRKLTDFCVSHPGTLAALPAGAKLEADWLPAETAGLWAPRDAGAWNQGESAFGVRSLMENAVVEATPAGKKEAEFEAGQQPLSIPPEARAFLLRLRTEPGILNGIDCGEFTLELIKTGHLSFDYPEHYVYNLVFPAANILITADMDLEKSDLLKGFTKSAYSVAFFNPIALWHRRWRDAIEALEFDRVFFYHIPGVEHDYFGYREKSLRYWEKQNRLHPNWDILI